MRPVPIEKRVLRADRTTVCDEVLGNREETLRIHVTAGRGVNAPPRWEVESMDLTKQLRLMDDERGDRELAVKPVK